ncbi:two-component system, OmpR family, sensor histidine kinase VicK [Dethiosulfatibacter aminovorans DSM 17477]|uniref:histidine kinase n=1 Tax=Dethiosulfatibacter aminovorans DSM 17477 TaxID=1121476 RepID=A0A1M6I057_9FIRM|nr:ATP-binding protein [Dethiosulfatibacter aminovorans]SHJ27823.1 two-component system, OmpR family, sensor histidine kinase VicK [Dethiosulfatibacter aminovorans DSM 17477]
MFKSIRWRFTLIYFLLVFMAMAMVGFFITDQLEKIQLDSITESMKSHISSILASSSLLQGEEWSENSQLIDELIENNVQIGYNESLYIILNDSAKTIIASSVRSTMGDSAYESRRIDNLLVLDSLKGDIVETIPSEDYDQPEGRVKHMAYPVNNKDGSIEGIIYLTYQLDSVYETIGETTIMLTRATMLALFVTVIFGFFLARSITGPIKDVTKKAREMSKGNFDQVVDVRSNDEIGQLAMMFNFLTKELKKNISSLHQEKSKMETTFNYMADGVITFDMKGRIIHANPVAKEILEIDDEKETDGNEILSNLDYQLTREALVENEFLGSAIINIDDMIYNINYAPFKNEMEEIGGVIFVMQDITEQQRLDDMRKEFVANVSHELKTPITTVKSYTETLLGGALEDRETAESFLNVILNESDRMDRLVKDLLRLSRMEFKQAKWNKVPLHPCSVLEETVEKLKNRAEDKNQNLVFGRCTEEIEVMFDKDGLEQIYQNIIGNAIKYTPENGEIKIGCHVEADFAVVEIEDNGIGIPEADIKRIFERFYRVDKARSREMGGTGLGLAITRHIAEAHHTVIEVESSMDKGTRFRIVMPLSSRGEKNA